MGGLRCAKEIIDQTNELLAQLETTTAGLRQSLGCMNASILLSAPEQQPTQEMYEDFEKWADGLAAAYRKGADEVAKKAAAIELLVGRSLS